jgi:general secretion pathway protein F
MAVFEYKALAESGKKVKGIIDADTAAAARRKLRDQKLYPTDVKESFGKDSGAETQSALKKGRGYGGVSTRDLTLMTRQMAVLLRAGMPLAEALKALIDQTSNARLQKTVYAIREQVIEGGRLAHGMAAHPRIFSPLYINMVRAGESSGTLEQVLFRLDDILDHQAKLKAKIVSTMAYPAFMAVFAVAIIGFLSLVVMPKITDLFTKRDQDLPKLTEYLMATTDFIMTYWYLLAGGVLLIYILWKTWVSIPKGRKAWDHLLLRLPLFGRLRRKLICGRFARILGTMLESGLTMMNALDVVVTIIGNKHIEESMDGIMASVRRGRGLSAPMKESGEFPAMFIHMVELGQRSGELESMLKQTADTYDDDVEVTIDALVSLLEPVIIIVMGLFVGVLVMSILMPILDMSSSIQ